MSAMTLIVDRRGAAITLDGKAVVQVRYPDGIQYRVGLKSLRAMVVQGEVTLSSGLLRACAAEGVGVVLLPGRGRGEGVNLLPQSRRQIWLRIAQVQCYIDTESRLAVAHHLVQAKVSGQERWLQVHGVPADFNRLIAHAQQASDLNMLMGVEGAASARYFALWQELWDDRWQFTGRNRRPPRDPVNALLSLGYTLAGQYVGRLATLRGLDESIGFLHEPRAGRPSLALDLLEPLRPYVDQWVWQHANMGPLEPSHFFSNEALGCRLNKDGRALFFDAWHMTVEEWLQAPARQGLALILQTLRKVHRPERS